MKNILRKTLLPFLALGFAAPAVMALTVHVDTNLSDHTAPGTVSWPWETPRGTHPENWAVWDTDPDGTTANTSFWSRGGNFTNIVANDFLELAVVPTNAEPVVFSFRMYDFMDRDPEATGQTQAYAELGSLSNVILFAFGVFTSNTHYSVRQWPTHNWVNTGIERSVGWHDVEFVILKDSVQVFVNEALAVSLPYTGNPIFNRLSLGGAFSNSIESFLFDDPYVANDPSYAPAVEISQQPSVEHPGLGAVSAFGESVTFNVVAQGTAGPLTYQWTQNGEELTDDARISGALTSSLTITGTDGPDSGMYRAVVTDANNNSVTSNPVRLTALFEHEVLMNAMDLTLEDYVGAEWGTLTATGGWFGWKSANTVNVLNAEGEPNPERLAIFTPTISQTGWYEVWTYFVPSFAGFGNNRTNEAPYNVTHSGGEDLVFISQQNPAGPSAAQWVLVGTYEFGEGTDGSVSISNLRKGPSGDGGPTGTFGSFVIADAVRFTPTSAPPVDLPSATVNIMRGVGGDVSVAVVGAPSTTYVMEVSEDLVDWTPLGDVTTNAEGVGELNDPDAIGTFSRRFYRSSVE